MINKENRFRFSIEFNVDVRRVTNRFIEEIREKGYNLSTDDIEYQEQLINTLISDQTLMLKFVYRTFIDVLSESDELKGLETLLGNNIPDEGELYTQLLSKLPETKSNYFRTRGLVDLTLFMSCFEISMAEAKFLKS